MTTYKEALKISMERYKELEEENKKLKEERDFFYKSAKQFREENEKLNLELSKLKEKYGDLDY